MAIAVVDEYQDRGCVLIRSLWPDGFVQDLRSRAVELYQGIAGWPPRPPATLHFNCLPKDFIKRALKRFLRTPAFSAYRNLLGNDICFPLVKCILRYHVPDGAPTMVAYHQDVDPKDSPTSWAIYEDVPVFNTWIALDHAGIDAPGLELIAKPVAKPLDEFRYHKTFLDRAMLTSFEEIERSAALEKAVGGRTMRPIFKPGDAVMFDHLLFHRTHITEQMDKPRMSMEVRACPAAGFVGRTGVNTEYAILRQSWLGYDHLDFVGLK